MLRPIIIINGRVIRPRTFQLTPINQPHPLYPETTIEPGYNVRVDGTLYTVARPYRIGQRRSGRYVIIFGRSLQENWHA